MAVCVTQTIRPEAFRQASLAVDVLSPALLVVDRQSPLMSKALRAFRYIGALSALLPLLHLAGCKTGALRQVQLEPSVNRPFIFIHQRKCGGTSVRDAVFRGAAALGLKTDTSFIPCYQTGAMPDL